MLQYLSSHSSFKIFGKICQKYAEIEMLLRNGKRILDPADFKNLVSFPKYDRLKLEFVFDQFLLCKILGYLKGP